MVNERRLSDPAPGNDGNDVRRMSRKAGPGYPTRDRRRLRSFSVPSLRHLFGVRTEALLVLPRYFAAESVFFAIVFSRSFLWQSRLAQSVEREL